MDRRRHGRRPATSRDRAGPRRGAPTRPVPHRRLPRFGTHLPPSRRPRSPTTRASRSPARCRRPPTVALAELASLPRREVVADFHCVAGWSATGLRWGGVAFADVYRAMIEPAVRPGTTITHVVFEGLDGYRSVALLEDVLADDVLIADHLDGQPLDARPRRAGAAGQPRPVRVRQHEAPVPHRGPRRRARRALPPLAARPPRRSRWSSRTAGPGSRTRNDTATSPPGWHAPLPPARPGEPGRRSRRAAIDDLAHRVHRAVRRRAADRAGADGRLRGRGAGRGRVQRRWPGAGRGRPGRLAWLERELDDRGRANGQAVGRRLPHLGGGRRPWSSARSSTARTR